MAKRTRKRVLLTNLADAERLRILNEHAVRGRWRSLDAQMWCLHCDKSFTGREARIYDNPEFAEDGGDGREVECGTPGCDGSPLDFASKPWWREDKN